MQNLLTKQINSKLPAANSRFAKAGFRASVTVKSAKFKIYASNEV